MDYLCCPGCTGDLLLEIEKQTEKEVVQGTLQCSACERGFKIQEGFPRLMFPDVLIDNDLRAEKWHDKYAQQYDRMNLHWDRKLLIWSGLWQTRAHRRFIDRLDLKKNASVLEVGVGTGINIPIISRQTGKKSLLHATDISSGMLKAAHKKMKIKDIEVELIHGNASYLPYKAGKFDAVLHAGALNQFGDKRRAIQEMLRVAKPGGKIVIFDEGLAPEKETTWHGKWILKHDSLFKHKPPVDLVPKNIEDLKVYYVWQKTHWIIEFRKKKQ